jgi:outer membrane protein OmpA-like peptidoglycan-associated protein
MKFFANIDLIRKMCLPAMILTLIIMQGCATVPEKNAALERARAAYENAHGNPDVTKYSPVALYEASQALRKAEEAKDAKEMEHLAYIAEKKAQIAVMQAEQKHAENERETLEQEKNKIVLQAREYETKQALSLAERKALEADAARKEAEARALEIERAKGEADALAKQAVIARTEAEARALEIERAKKEAEARALELEQAKKESDVKTLEAEMARKKAEEAVTQRKEAESELAELKAKQTEGGVVLTLSDILFETGKASLMSGAMRSIDVLADFLKKHPTRNILIEGFTDSVGSETYNLGLSQKRADAVSDALKKAGIADERITTKGHGEGFPLASNSIPAGRQQNRRVEITILDEGVSAEKIVR